MKHVLIFMLIPLCFIACTGTTTETPAAPAKDSAAAVVLPYTATYSSSFVAGKPSDVLATLNNYKAWETNDMKGLRATVGDSLTLIFSDGGSMMGLSDSLIKIASKYRDSLSNVALTFYAWTSNHSVDKNEDWVNVWYKEVDTHKSGKVDSAIYQDDNLLKDGKIVWSSSHMQKLKK